MIFILILTLSIGIFALVSAVLTFPDSSTLKVLEGIKKNQSITEQLDEQIVMPIARLVVKFVRIDEYKEVKLRRTLARAKIEFTPHEYFARAITISALTIVSSFLFIPLGIPIFTLLILMLGVILYFKNMQMAADKIKNINEQIVKELPRFIRTYNSATKVDKRIINCIEKYLIIAGDAMKYDLEMLLIDLKTMDEVESLKRFSERVNVSYLNDFITGVIAATQGEDQSAFFAITEQNMNMLARENLKKEVLKRPAKIKKATIAVGVMLFLLYMYPILLDLKNGLGIFN